MSETTKHQSTLASHPDVAPVLPRFIARLPSHVTKLRELLAANDREGLQYLAHQLKGSGKSFGYEGMSTFAWALEETLHAAKPTEEVATAVTHLTNFIEHIEDYNP